MTAIHPHYCQTSFFFFNAAWPLAPSICILLTELAQTAQTAGQVGRILQHSAYFRQSPSDETVYNRESEESIDLHIAQ